MDGFCTARNEDSSASLEVHVLLGHRTPECDLNKVGAFNVRSALAEMIRSGCAPMQFALYTQG
jgi:hypothetical protein